MLNSPAHIKDVDGYIYFSPRTQGFTGRPVKIHPSLFVDFLCAVDPSTADGEAVMRDIEGLKSTAQSNDSPMPAKPLSWDKSAGKHRAGLDKAYLAISSMERHRRMVRENSLVTKNVRVYYHIHQKANDQYPTVYVSEIQVRREARDPGGFYETGTGTIAGRAKKVSNCNLNGKTVFISGASRTVADAMKDAKTATSSAKSTLFFTPASAAEDLTVWKENRHSGATKSLVDELQKTLRENQQSKVSWVVEGEGAALLSHAVQKHSGSLENHDFTFTNPRANLPRLLQALGQRKAHLEGDFIKFNPSAGGAAFASALAVASQKQTLLRELAALPATQSKVPEMGTANQILRLALMNNLSAVGSNSRLKAVVALPQALRGNKKTFVEALLAVRPT